MPRWTVSIGQGDDIIVVERTGTDLVAIDIPTHRPVLADRAAIEELRRKLGAAIADDGGDDVVG